jgi:hypothetical protein
MAFRRPRVRKSWFHSSRESASPWPTPAVMNLASCPRQDGRNCAGADTVSYVELDAEVDEAAEYPTIKGLGVRLTGSRS